MLIAGSSFIDLSNDAFSHDVTGTVLVDSTVFILVILNSEKCVEKQGISPSLNILLGVFKSLQQHCADFLSPDEILVY